MELRSEKSKTQMKKKKGQMIDHVFHLLYRKKKAEKRKHQDDVSEAQTGAQGKKKKLQESSKASQNGTGSA